MGDQPIAKGRLPDPPNPKSILCTKEIAGIPRPGISVGYWQPVALIEVTRIPFCLMSFGALQWRSPGKVPFGSVGSDLSMGQHAFYHAHYYHYPVFDQRGFLSDKKPSKEADFDLVWMSEFDPTWLDDRAALVWSPEASALTGRLAHAACVQEAVQLRLNQLPNDHLVECLGGHGSVTPLNGHVKPHLGGVQSSVLLAERVLIRLHRLEQIRHKQVRPFQKSHYRYQMIYPRKGRCHPLGYPTEGGHSFPKKGEDFSYFIWKKVRHCVA